MVGHHGLCIDNFWSLGLPMIYESQINGMADGLPKIAQPEWLA